MTPEQKSRVSVDALLQQAVWHVCDRAHVAKAALAKKAASVKKIPAKKVPARKAPAKKAANPKPPAPKVAAQPQVAASAEPKDFTRIKNGLAKMGDKAPHKLKSFQRHVGAQLGKGSTAEQIDAVLQKLEKAGLVLEPMT